MMNFRFCELQNRQRKCLSFVRILKSFQKKKGLQGEIPLFSQDFDVISKKEKKGLWSLHADFLV